MQNAKGPKSFFRSDYGSSGGFFENLGHKIWGLVCIDKWSRNFDSATRSAIFVTPKMAKMAPWDRKLFSLLGLHRTNGLKILEFENFDTLTYQGTMENCEKS